MKNNNSASIFVSTTFALLCLCLPMYAIAASSSPNVLLDNVAKRMVGELNAKKTTIKTNPASVYKIVRTLLVPHVDVMSMSRSALGGPMGRPTWKKANKQQRIAFSQEFTRLVIRTYSSALAKYTNETVQFSKPTYYKNGQRAYVRSRIIRPGGPPIQVNYRLRLQGSQWKIYDMSVEGISLLQSYREQFEQELSKIKTPDKMAGLIRALKQLNTRHP